MPGIMSEGSRHAMVPRSALRSARMIVPQRAACRPRFAVHKGIVKRTAALDYSSAHASLRRHSSVAVAPG